MAPDERRRGRDRRAGGERRRRHDRRTLGWPDRRRQNWSPLRIGRRAIDRGEPEIERRSRPERRQGERRKSPQIPISSHA